MALESLPTERGRTANSLTTDRDKMLLTFVKERVSYARQRLSGVVDQWKENFDCFATGPKFSNKEDWQSKFSVNEVASSVRTGVSRVRNNFLRRSDWFSLTGTNEEAEEKQSLLDKAMRYQLKRANFRRVSNTFLLSTALSIGIMRVGWKFEKIKNPRLILKDAEREINAFNKAVAKDVENPQLPITLPTEKELLDSVELDIAEALGFAEGDTKKEVVKEYIQRSVLELKPVNPFDFFFDPDCGYPDESSWHAEETYVPLWQVKELGKNGVYKNTENLSPSTISPEKTVTDARFKNLSGVSTSNLTGNLVKITEYFGNVVVNNVQTETYHHIVIANDTVVIRDKPNAFWADGYSNPYVIACLHEIPFKPTGSSMVDGAIPLQRILDSNYQLTVDQMRLGIIGLNIIDKTKLVDPSILLDGIEPGKYLEVNGKPDDVFKHYNLTSNVENTVFPMNALLVQGIQKATGVNQIIQGQAAQRSRTSAEEIRTQVQGSEGVLYTSAEDLEIQWLIPMLEKTLARILQFGLDGSDPQFLSTLEESEVMALEEFSGPERYNNYASFWEFEINGFANEGMRMDELSRINEALKLYNTGGPLSQLMNGPYLLKEWASKANFKDPSKVVLDNSEIEEIISENRLLTNGHYVSIGPDDNDEFHLAEHQKTLMLSNGNTPEMMMHIQEHSVRLRQKQMQQSALQGQAQVGPQPQTTSADLRQDDTSYM